MNFPIQPTVPLPTWATNVGSIKLDPGVTKRNEGWVNAGPGLQYGEAPPFPYVNNELYNNGVWATYFKECFDYITQGNLKERGIVFNRYLQDTLMVTDNNLIFPTTSMYNVLGNPYNMTTGVFTAQQTGWHRFSLCGFKISNQTGASNYFRYYINGYVNSTMIDSILFSQEYISNNRASRSATSMYYLNAGDQLSFKFDIPTFAPPVNSAAYIIEGSSNLSWNFS